MLTLIPSNLPCDGKSYQGNPNKMGVLGSGSRSALLIPSLGPSRESVCGRGPSEAVPVPKATRLLCARSLHRKESSTEFPVPVLRARGRRFRRRLGAKLPQTLRLPFERVLADNPQRLSEAESF